MALAASAGGMGHTDPVRSRDSLLRDLLADALANAPFTQFVSEHRPLSAALEQFGALLRRQVSAVKTLGDLDRLEASVPELLASIRPDIPALGPGGHGRVEEDEIWSPPDAAGKRHAMTRFWFRRQIIGEPGLLNRWPSDGSLTVIDRDSEHAFLSPGEAVWSIHVAEGDQYALYTPIDLTNDEVDLVHAGRLDVQEIYDSRQRSVLPIIAAIATESAEYFDRLLPRELKKTIQARRRTLSAFASVTRGVSFPETWKLERPRVAVSPAAPDRDRSYAAQVHATPAFRDRLAEASFEDLQRAIRVWANAIERYPEAFNALEEERISDLLAATLHASLPGADREVFSRRGKTDIQVRAKALDDGASEARIFIAETKFATSTNVVREALDPQLFGYLNSADTAAVLLLLFRQKNRVRAYSRYLPVLKEVTGFLCEEDSAVQGWKINRYLRDGKELRLLLATVHVPPLRSVQV